MKLRTNARLKPGSINYIIARKEELSQQQKEAIINFVVDRMLGEKKASNEIELEQYLEEDGEYVSKTAKECLQKSVKKGLSVFSGWVCKKGTDETVILLQDLWQKLETADADSFVRVDTELF